MSARSALDIADKCPVDASLDLSDPAIRAANAVLVELGGRRGFDQWFDNIDDDIRVEIVNDAAEVIGLVYPKPVELTEEQIKEIAIKAADFARESFERNLNRPVKDYCAPQGYVDTHHKLATLITKEIVQMSDIKKNVLDLAALVKADLTLGEAGIVEVKDGLFERTLPESLTPETVKTYQNHVGDLVAATALALGEVGIDAFKADEKLEQLSVEFGCGSDSLAGTIQRSKDYPAGGIPKEGETRDPNAVVTKYGIISMKYGVNAHANKGSLKKVRDTINERAREALAKG
ncbi:hypothetical protein D3C71_376580 [compost metagenome]